MKERVKGVFEASWHICGVQHVGSGSWKVLYFVPCKGMCHNMTGDDKRGHDSTMTKLLTFLEVFLLCIHYGK